MSNQIELRHLRYFMAVSEHLNFHRAADQLDITQPGLSRQIQQLEFHLGTELLVRNRREVRLTPAGAYLREQLIPQLNRLENIYRQTRRIAAGQSGEIRIGFLGSAMQDVIPRLLLDLRKQFPEIRTSLEELSNQAQVRALLEERLDLGFVRLSDLPPELEGCAVMRETFSMVVPSDHPMKGPAIASAREFSEEPFILFTPEYSPDYYRTVLSICEDAGFHPRVSHKSVHAHTIFKLVAAGLGVAIVPTSLQHGFRLKVRFLELSEIRQRAVLTAVWNRSHHSKALEHCIERLKVQSPGA
ncbi:LysR family transcriptional regulator [Robiginitalea sp. SC105]|uniref:LysR family transcriptional regulator n=1 Tax=Robiginitalea sp. SC105 TaxID=2762332 RepID=UPI001639FD4F|nr:LysR family transcriptional regulator [Robiginitalea sp. SC105]MBC2838668.1 LysR family transcriptional regulator [Robiginitalea sp. SC105]